MRKQDFKWGTLLLLPVFAFAQTVSAAPSVSEGEVLSLVPKGDGWTLTVKVATGEKKFEIGKGTLISTEVTADQVRKGERILRSGAGGGDLTPLAGISKETKKLLGLPDIPPIPKVPQIPKIPKGIPGQGGGGPGPGAGAPPAGGPPPGPGGPEGGAPPKGKAPKEEPPKVKTQDDLLDEKGFQNQKLLFPGGGKDGASAGVKVTDVKRTTKGIELKVESAPGKAETLTMSFDQKVRKAIEAVDLKPHMQVRLEIAGEKGKEQVASITVFS